jgi:uncharacterized damage-inducible protein DinB
MKHLKIFCLLALVCSAAGAFAQAATPNAQAKKPATPPTIASAIDQQVSILEREFVGAAEAMPDDKFNFTPITLNIPGSEYKTVKTFAEEVRHVAATNYLLWGAITGDKSPIPSTEDNGPSSLKTKAEIIKYLTAENAAALVPSPFGQGQTTKLFCATFSVAHAFDHYGQMVEYLRMNGIIPPASRGNN